METLYLLDYGAGNVLSLVNAVNKLGYTIKTIQKPSDFAIAQKLIFPGVGSFGAAMQRLTEKGYIDPLMTYLKSGKPFFGICVGMQVLFNSSQESPDALGLGLIAASVKKFSTDGNKSVPHMGWNGADSKFNTLLNHEPNSRYYFVHSYAVPFDSTSKDLSEWIHSLTTYENETFVSSIKKGNIFATQFHPEKSGWAGLKILKTFLESPSIENLSAPYNGEALTIPECKLSKRIIVALDVRANDAGDLIVTKGDQYDVRESDQTGNPVRNMGKPIEMARNYFQQGADEITFLNITSFRDIPVNDLPMLQLLKRTSESVFVPLCVGGGIRQITEPNGNIVSALDVASQYFRSGADKVSIGSDAVYAVEEYLRNGKQLSGNSSIEQISKVYGVQAVVISVDPKRIYVTDPKDTKHHVIETKVLGPKGEKYCWYQCTVKGGREGRDVDVIQLVTTCELMGAGEILLNCMDKDGTNSGFDLELKKLVQNSVGIPVVASSGAGNPQDFEKVFKECGVDAALAAGILHRNEYTVGDIKEYLNKVGVKVRL